VSTDPGIWGWTSDIGRLGFTVTFSLGLAPEEVLNLYGAHPSRAEFLDRHEASLRYPPNYGGAQLRVGTVGRWGFCFEEAGVEGIKTRTLSGLSAETETIAFYTGPSASSFIYLKDGQGVEAFEPGLPHTLFGDEPHKFWEDTQKILGRAAQNQAAGPMDPIHAVLQSITKHVRGLIDRAVLEGPLLTAFLADAERAPVNPDPGAAPEAAPQPEPQQPAPPSQPYPWSFSSAASLRYGRRAS
jgi:hypothetical protein